MRKSLFYLVILFTSLSATNAKDFALVVGGSSTVKEPDTHEFARTVLTTGLGLKAQGHEVVTLFSSYGEKEEISPMDRARMTRDSSHVPLLEQTKYAKDYDKIKEKLPDTKAATKENIINSLNDIKNKIGAGDTFSFILNAHGTVACTNNRKTDPVTGDTIILKDELSSDFDPNCDHEITIFDPQSGQFTKMKTQEIFPILKAMEAKGANINLVAESCHSGILKKELEGLNNTCSVLLASGDSVGYGCFESDSDEIHDYTSTLEYIKYQAYSQISDELKNDPYFKSSKCFNKVTEHANKLGIDYDTEDLDKIFWKARKEDKAIHEPSQSSMHDFDYFSKGRFSGKMNVMLRYNSLICVQDSINPLEEMLPWILPTMKVPFQELISRYESTLNAYNQNLEDQKPLVKEQNIHRKSTDPKVQEELKKINQQLLVLQKENDKIAKEIIDIDRELGDYFEAITTKNNSSTCANRKL